MGFSLQMTLVSPWKRMIIDPEGKEIGHYTLWKPHAVMAGYVSWGHNQLQPTGRDLADACMFSWLRAKLVRKSITPTPNMFAPPFAIIDDALREKLGSAKPHPLHWVQLCAPFLPNKAEMLLPLWNEAANVSVIPDEQLLLHNHTRSMPFQDLRTMMKDTRYDPVFNGSLLMWVPAREVAGWLFELRTGKLHKSQAYLKHDKDAKAIVEARHKYIEALGKRKYRILFTSLGVSFSDLHAIPNL